VSTREYVIVNRLMGRRIWTGGEFSLTNDPFILSVGTPEELSKEEYGDSARALHFEEAKEAELLAVARIWRDG
jgi:hypothetical protein